MPSKVIFRTSKNNVRRRPFCQKNKILYSSKMARNAIESEFRTSKMTDGSHLKKYKLHIDLKWPEM